MNIRKHIREALFGDNQPTDTDEMKRSYNRDKLVLALNSNRTYMIYNEDTGEIFADGISYIELEDILIQLGIDQEIARELASNAEKMKVVIP